MKQAIFSVVSAYSGNCSFFSQWTIQQEETAIVLVYCYNILSAYLMYLFHHRQ